MTQTNIAILGGGIAGLCSAIALDKKNFRITVYERNSELKYPGAGLVLWPNVIHILDKLHLLNDVKSKAWSLNKMQRYTETGEFLSEIELKQFAVKTTETNYAISRKCLHAILINKLLQLKIEVQFNHCVSKIESCEKNTTKVFFDNGQQIKADIIIGADGRMNSIARKYVTGDNKPIYQNYVNWVGLIEANTNLYFENNILDYWGCGERFGIVPLSANSAYWAGCKAMPEAMGNPESGNKNKLLTIFKHWPEKIAKIIEQTPTEHIKRIEVYDHDPLSKWYRDNVCLIGDAAHAALPTSGQGACQAIEDAYFLAEYLEHENSRIKPDFQSAYEQFYNARFDTTTTIIQNARHFASSLFNTDPKFCAARNEKARH